MSCKECIYAGVGDADPNNIRAERPLLCKRFPPTLHMFPAGNGALAQVTAFPQVSSGMECGEFDDGSELDDVQPEGEAAHGNA